MTRRRRYQYHYHPQHGRKLGYHRKGARSAQRRQANAIIDSFMRPLVASIEAGEIVAADVNRAKATAAFVLVALADPVLEVDAIGRESRAVSRRLTAAWNRCGGVGPIGQGGKWTFRRLRVGELHPREERRQIRKMIKKAEPADVIQLRKQAQLAARLLRKVLKKEKAASLR